VHVGVLLFTVLALIIGVVSIGLTGVNIAKNGASLIPKVGHEDVLQAAQCSMSTSSFLSPLYHLGHPSSSPVCLGTSTFGAIFACSPLDTDTIHRLYVTWRDHLEQFAVFCFGLGSRPCLACSILRCCLPTRHPFLERGFLGVWTRTGFYSPSSCYVRHRDSWLVFVQR